MMSCQCIEDDGFVVVNPYSAISQLYSPTPQARERAWLLTHLQATLVQLRLGLEECHALLSPPSPPPSSAANPAAVTGGGSSTLVLTTPRHETVKGHVTRVGTRLVRGTVSLRLKTLPPQTLTLSPSRPLRLAPLAALQGLLVRAVSLLRGLEGGRGKGKTARKMREDRSESECREVATRLRVLARYLADALVLIKGGAGAGPSVGPSAASSSAASSPSTTSTPISVPFPMPGSGSGPRPTYTRTPTSQAGAAGWTTHSASLTHFFPPPPPQPVSGSGPHNPSHSHAHTHHHTPSAVADPLSSIPRNISIYLTIEDASLVLYVRALEAAGQPTSLGARLALAIGTTRRIDHDESDRLFRYACDDESRPVGDAVGGNSGGGAGGVSSSGSSGGSSGFLTVSGGGAGRPVSSSGPGLSVSVPGSSSGHGHRHGDRHRPVSSSGISSGTARNTQHVETHDDDHHHHHNKNDDDEDDRDPDPRPEEDCEDDTDADTPKPHSVDVYVREKVRVESADPSLLSLSAKLGALSNALALARRNLDVVLADAEDDGVAVGGYGLVTG